jgi:hypothetical protein
MKNVQNRHVAIEAFLRIRRLEVVILTDLMKTDKSSSNALRRFLLISHNSAPTDEVCVIGPPTSLSRHVRAQPNG